MSKRNREPERSAGLGTFKRRVRFKPPGAGKNERTGTIQSITVDGPLGTTYQIEDERGYRYSLKPERILAPEETDR